MSENRYLEDKSADQRYRDEGLLNTKNLIIGSALVAGSIFAYRSGALKSVIKESMKEAAEHRPTISAMFNDLRKWTKSDFGTPDKSIFRMGVKDTIKEFAKFDKDNARAIVKSTKDDWKLYEKRLGDTLERLTKDSSKALVRNSYHNTELLDDIKGVDAALDAYSDSKLRGKAALKTKSYDDIIKSNIQSVEKKTKSLNRTGTRNVELEDLFNIEIDKSGKVKLTEKTKFNFSQKNKDVSTSAKEQIENMLNSSVVGEDGVVTKNGKRALRMHEKHKDFNHMIIDKSLHVDDGGNIIDLRNRKKMTQETIRNLATEWQVPVIGVNPLRMVGLDKLGKKRVRVGSISEDTVAPFLTGIKGNSKDNTIKNLKDKVEVLKDVDEAVTIINGDVYRMAEDGNGIVKMAYKEKKELIHIPKHMDRLSALNPVENSLRKMSGITTRTFEDYTKEDGFKYYLQKMAKFFDVGYQESSRLKDTFDNAMDYTNPDSYMEKVLTRIRPKPYKDSKVTNSFSNLSTPGVKRKPSESFFVVNKSTTLKDVAVNGFNKESIKKYAYQHVADFNKDYESVNRRTGVLHFMLERMNQTISSVGLGLSVESTGSSFDTAKNLFLKRFMPVYGAYQAYQFVNMIGEDGTENGKKPSTLHQHVMSSIAKTDVGLHAMTEKMGFPRFLENLSQLTPGSDMLEELPGITSLNLHQTSDERADYWKNGYDPVRKGRFWSLNDTPFVGGKVQYFKANPLRRSLADARYSDSLYGSRKEYFASILNPGYYDKKHYNDRPYLMSSAAFENAPLVGPLLSSTIGRIIKPPKKMHEEYWNLDENRPKTKQEIAFDSKENLGYIASINELRSENSEKNKEIYLKDKQTIASVFKFGKGRPSSVPITPPITELISKENKFLSAYRTSGGVINTVDLGESGRSAKYKINKKDYNLSQIMGVKDSVSLTNDYLISPEMIDNEKYSDVDSPYSLENTLQNQYVNSANVAGIYGFVATGFLTGNPGAGESVIETSGYSRSFNRAFWDMEVGGASGDISEIFRRFVQKRRNDVNYYNPVRNTQADWIKIVQYKLS